MTIRTALFISCVFVLVIPDLTFAAGFQVRSAPDPDDQPLKVGIWYPSDAPTSRIEGLREPVAFNGRITGGDLPLIVISHGNGGGLSGHSDTALALANEGFVVVSVSHTGDNHHDQSYAGKTRWFTDRPRHIQRVLDYMLTQWPERTQLDESRIGFFGFSMGGFTGLVVAGATPAFEPIRAYCAEHPTEFTCTVLKRLNSETLTVSSPPASSWVHDARVGAAVLAAPGFLYAFELQEIATIDIPIQFWVAEHDERVHAETLVRLQESRPGEFEFHAVQNAGHFAFLPPCNFSSKLCFDPEGFDRKAFHDELNDAVVSFFKRTLVSAAP